MARIRTVTVEFRHRLGFEHSYSSVEATIGEVIEIERGDDPEQVRRHAIRRLRRQVRAEAKAFKQQHDHKE